VIRWMLCICEILQFVWEIESNICVCNISLQNCCMPCFKWTIRSSLFKENWTILHILIVTSLSYKHFSPILNVQRHLTSVRIVFYMAPRNPNAQRTNYPD